MELLALWTAKAWFLSRGEDCAAVGFEALVRKGRELLEGPYETVASLEGLGEDVEKSKRKVLIRKPWQAYRAYSEMIVHYAMGNVLKYFEGNSSPSFEYLSELSAATREKMWVISSSFRYVARRNGFS